MQCFVYKGRNKTDHFLYLVEQLDSNKLPEQVPTGLLELLGELDLVLDFDLEESRKLPNADARQILLALEQRGYYYQMPKDDMYRSEEHYFN